jgi:3-phenylpropionate/trans-cinnamate dioxygenase ferredoxin subunit
MSEWMHVAKLSQMADPGKETVEVADRLVVLFRIGGEVYCLDDVCTHDGGPLGEGDIEDHTVACPRHGAKFDIRDGQALTMPATEATTAHKVKLDGDDIYVRVTES